MRKPTWYTHRGKYDFIIEHLEVDVKGECWLANRERSRSIRPNGRGYFMYTTPAVLQKEGAPKDTILHRAILHFETETIDLYYTDGLDASHLCHHKACCYPGHLIAEPHHINSKRNPLVGQVPTQKLSPKDAH